MKLFRRIPSIGPIRTALVIALLLGKMTGEKLSTLGVKTVADLRTLERSRLEEQFGRYGARLYEPARGIDANPVVSDQPTQSISVEDQLEEDMLLTETEADPATLKLWASRKEARGSHWRLKLKLASSKFHPQPYGMRTSILLRGAYRDRPKLREQVTLGPQQRNRLVGVGLSNFRGSEQTAAQPAPFD